MSAGVSRENALSDAVGALLLVAVVGMAVTILGVAIISQSQQERVPALKTDIIPLDGGRTILLAHNGGDSLQKSEMLIVVDGNDYTDLFTRDGTGWSSWSVGEFLNYSVPEGITSLPQSVSIYYIGGKSAYLIQSMGVPPAVNRSPSTAPVAAFTSDKQSGATPLTVRFTDQSAGTKPFTYKWDFTNDGSTDSTEKNPEYTYTADGNYTVRLTVTNIAGSNSATALIVVQEGPVAAFTSDITSGVAPLTVQFTDGSTGTAPLTYEWDFNNDGLIDSTVKNPSYQYANTGRYTVKLTVRNAIGSDEEVKLNYITVNPNPPWYNCDWSYRKNITIDKSRVSGTLSDFPVLIHLASDNDLRNGTRSDGYDILFTASDGTTKLPHEIETYVNSTGELFAWVKVPAVRSSANTTLYMYYNNSNAVNQQDKTNVWTNYKTVWHMTENPSGAAPQILDSTSNAYHATTGTVMTASQQVPAKINGGLYFDGNDNLTTSYYQTSVTAYSIDTWIKTSTTNTLVGIVNDRGYDENIPGGTGLSLTLSVGGTYGGGPNPGAGIVDYGVDSNGIYYGDYSNTTKTINDNTWHHVVGTWAGSGPVDPSQFRIYIDGDPMVLTAVTIGTRPTPPLSGLSGYGTKIAQHQPWKTYLQGTLDETRISTATLSADWIKTEYNNQNSPPTFHYLGNQEQWTC